LRVVGALAGALAGAKGASAAATGLAATGAVTGPTAAGAAVGGLRGAFGAPTGTLGTVAGLAAAGAVLGGLAGAFGAAMGAVGTVTGLAAAEVGGLTGANGKAMGAATGLAAAGAEVGANTLQLRGGNCEFLQMVLCTHFEYVLSRVNKAGTDPHGNAKTLARPTMSPLLFRTGLPLSPHGPPLPLAAQSVSDTNGSKGVHALLVAHYIDQSLLETSRNDKCFSDAKTNHSQ
jgi:hypothetical protein